MVTGSTDHNLLTDSKCPEVIIRQLACLYDFKILHASTSALSFPATATSSSSCHLIIATLVSLVSIRLQLSALAPSEVEVLRIAREPSPNK